MCFKKFIARRGRPELVYSDNGTAFEAAAMWLQVVRKDKKFNDNLAELEIEWRFNLSRAPWWGVNLKASLDYSREPSTSQSEMGH
jgi:wobble nucleotide-excising tRNase